MKTKWSMPFTAVLLCAAVLMCALVGAGCGESKVKVMVFMGKSSKSYDSYKAVVDGVRKKYGDQVDFVIVDFDKPANKGELKKYHVDTNPHTIVFDTKGKIYWQGIGSVPADMLVSYIEPLIPGKKATTSSQPTSTSPTMTPYATTTPGQSGTAPSGVPGATGQ
jgi:hypothetical protein